MRISASLIVFLARTRPTQKMSYIIFLVIERNDLRQQVFICFVIFNVINQCWQGCQEIDTPDTTVGW